MGMKWEKKLILYLKHIAIYTNYSLRNRHKISFKHLFKTNLNHIYLKNYNEFSRIYNYLHNEKLLFLLEKTD